MDNYQPINHYLETHLDESVAELSRLCAQPSVAAQNWGLSECAALVAEMLQKRGFLVEILPTAGAPVVLGELKGLSDKTLLFYNHYDVQPPEPLELWETPPFEPTLKDGKLFARGVSDAKGEHPQGLVAPFFPAILAGAQIPVHAFAGIGGGLGDIAIFDDENTTRLVFPLEAITDYGIEGDFGERIAQFRFVIPGIAEINHPVFRKQCGHEISPPIMILKFAFYPCFARNRCKNPPRLSRVVIKASYVPSLSC